MLLRGVSTRCRMTGGDGIRRRAATPQYGTLRMATPESLVQPDFQNFKPLFSAVQSRALHPHSVTIARLLNRTSIAVQQPRLLCLLAFLLDSLAASGTAKLESG